MTPEVEKLISRLLSHLPQVRDAETLVGRAHIVFEAAIVFLTRLEGHNPVAVACAPESETEWVQQNMALLRNWWQPEPDPPQRDERCFSLEKRLSLDGREYADMLVARDESGKYELAIIHRRDGEQYRTWHTCAAQAFVRQAEARHVLREKKVLERAVIGDVLPDESWDAFLDRQDTAASSTDALLTCAMIWTGYHSRPESLKPEGARDCYPGDARQWLAHAAVPTEAKVAYQLLLDGMLNPATDTKDLAFGIRRLLERAQSATPQTMGDRRLNRGNLDRAAAVLVLEHAWRRVRDEHLVRDEPRGSANAAQAARAVSAHLDATVEATRVELLDALVHWRATDTADAPTSRVDRDTLRLYFANLLLTSELLRRSHLGLADAGGNGPHDGVPSEVSREYRVQLARFMLGAVGTLGRLVNVRPSKTAVSGPELLDSLLYLVDRYVHIQLGADERLRVREHLARALVAEVELHLGRERYRDHLLHVIDVFLLGHLLLRTRVRWTYGNTLALLDHFIALECGPSGSSDGRKASPETWMRDWALAALLHDVGYQLVPASSVDVDPKRLAAYFRLPGTPKPGWLGVDRTQGWRDFVDSLTQQFRDPAAGDSSWLPAPGTYGCEDHGILSALRLAQELVQAASVESDSPVDWSLLHGHRRALHAIARHNLFGVTVRLGSDPMACLLRLCDELQEWNRRRINIENSIKRLYLQIEASDGGVDGYESLSGLEVNLVFSRAPETKASAAPGDGLAISLAGEGANFEFGLLYHDSMQAQFDPTTTWLSKAYALQHVDVSTPSAQAASVRWRIELCFPRPLEYGSLSEFDLYELFRDQERELPRLRTWDDRQAGRGLWRLPDVPDEPCDRVAIIMSADPGNGDPERHRKLGALLRLHPQTLFKKFVDFKKEQLATRDGLRPRRRV